MAYRNRSRKRRYVRKKAKRNVRRKLTSHGKGRTNYGSYYQAAATGAKAAYKAAQLYDRYRGGKSKSTQVLQDYRRVGVKYGRKISTAKRAKKLTRQNINTKILSLRDYGAWGRGSGNVKIGSYQPTGPGTELVMPVQLWDLTTMPQGRGVDLLYSSTFFELRFTNETDTAEPRWYTVNGGVFQPVGSITDAGTIHTKEANLYTTYVSDTNDLTLSLHEGGKDSFIEKFNAQLILNGPQARPVKWCVQLVQLSEEVTPGQDNGSEIMRNFWMQMAKPYGYSPIETGPRMELRKHYKVLKSFYVNMDSPENSEDHIVSRQHHLDFKGNLNRKCNYRWDWRGDGIALTDKDIPEDNTTSVFSTHVHPKARVYLMVRALCEHRTSEAWGALRQPSYDIKLDVYHKNLD